MFMGFTFNNNNNKTSNKLLGKTRRKSWLPRKQVLKIMCKYTHNTMLLYKFRYRFNFFIYKEVQFGVFDFRFTCAITKRIQFWCAPRHPNLKQYFVYFCPIWIVDSAKFRPFWTTLNFKSLILICVQYMKTACQQEIC